MRIDFRQKPSASEKSGNKTFLARLLNDFLGIIPDAFKVAEIFMDIKPGFFLTDAQIFSQSAFPHAVKYTEIYYFGPSSHFGRDFIFFDIKNFAGGGRVNILSGQKSVFNFFII